VHNPFGAYLYILLLYELLAARFLAKNAQKQISGQEAQERIYISAKDAAYPFQGKLSPRNQILQ
jgi:hypothetical protein